MNNNVFSLIIQSLDEWVQRHAPVILTITIILLMIMITGLLVAILNCSHISATESGVTYNQMRGII